MYCNTIRIVIRGKFSFSFFLWKLTENGSFIVEHNYVKKYAYIIRRRNHSVIFHTGSHRNKFISLKNGVFTEENL